MKYGRTRGLVKLLKNQLIDPKLGAEIGVDAGDNVRGMLEAYPNLRMIAVDIWDANRWDFTKPIGSSGMATRRSLFFDNIAFAMTRVTVYQLDSTLAANNVQDGSLDFVFIDGNHFYDGIKADLQAWFSKVRKGGLFCGHDYGGIGGKLAGWGVKKAVDEFAKAYSYEVNVRRVPEAVWWWIV